MKNILYCETNRDGTIGGSFFSLLFLVKGLDKTMYKPIVIFYSDNALIPRYQEAGADVHVLKLPNSFVIENIPYIGTIIKKMPSGLRKVFQFLQKPVNLVLFFFWPVLRNAWFLIRNKVALLHLNNTINWNHEWMLAAKLTGVKCITHERGINHVFRPMAKTFGKLIDGIICISAAVQSNLLKHGFEEAKLRLIYNGIDPAQVVVKKEREEVYSEFGIQNASPIIGMVGNIKYWKGQETVVKAVARLKHLYPDILCIFVGVATENDRDYMDKLQAIIDKEGISKNILFTGYHSNVADIVNIMQVVIHASVDPEPFGRVLIEAMSMKKPLIGANGGAVPEIIQDKVSGRVFKPGDDEDLEKCLVEILADQDKAVSYSDEGYERLKKLFHIDINTSKTQQFYSELLNMD